MADLSAIKCIVFDLDDTLWDCQAVIDHAERMQYQWLVSHAPVIGEKISFEQFVEARVHYFAHHPKYRHNLGLMRSKWLAELFEQYQLADVDIQRAFDVFYLARQQVALFPGVVAGLAELQSKYILGVITNGNSDLAVIGLDHYFDTIVSSAEAGCSKPSVEIFRYFERQSGFSPQDLLYVGDDWQNDVQAPKDAGWAAIWYNAAQKRSPTGLEDGQITDLRHIFAIINS